LETFTDVNGYTVNLEFSRDAFEKEAEHVLIACRFYDQWLLTKHKLRGWEFPGGKRENGETLEEAAIREVSEETGAVLNKLVFIGEYEVLRGQDSFVKAIFYGEVKELNEKEDYIETNGPLLIGGDLLTLRFQDTYSFLMKDPVIEHAIGKIDKILISKRNGTFLPSLKIHS
jgi:8-oxo-dGTP diphosphatase